MDSVSYCPNAVRVDKVLDPSTGKLRFPWGLCVHTTGSGVPTKAAKKGKRPIDVALDIYRKSQSGWLHPYKWGGPTYVLDYDGALYQLAPDEVMTAHCGGPHREKYLSGVWVKGVSLETYAHWVDSWRPRYESPQHLFPSKSPNTDYVGVEMIPVLDAPIAMAPGLRFTRAQHDGVISLGKYLAARHGWPLGWANSSRLVGHEDVQPLERQDKGGGWDPGWLRAKPYFDFGYVRSALQAT